MKNQTSSLTLVNKFNNFVIRENLLFPKNKLLIALSGGQDSICLVILLRQLMNQFNLKFGLIYCIHFWSVNNLYHHSHLLKLSFIMENKGFFPLVLNKSFTENNARNWRRSIIYRISTFYNYQKLVTGHSLTDRIETLLLNLFRGSGDKGVTALTNNQFLLNKSVKKNFLSELDLNV